MALMDNRNQKQSNTLVARYKIIQSESLTFFIDPLPA